jgi:hypothetical protein
MCAIHGGTAIFCRGECFKVQPVTGGSGFEVVLAQPYSFVGYFEKKEVAEAVAFVLNNVDAIRLLATVVDVAALRDQELKLLTDKFSDPYYDE